MFYFERQGRVKKWEGRQKENKELEGTDQCYSVAEALTQETGDVGPQLLPPFECFNQQGVGWGILNPHIFSYL